MRRPEDVALCDAEALRLMKHAVRTSFGVSKDIIVRDEIIDLEG